MVKSRQSSLYVFLSAIGLVLISFLSKAQEVHPVGPYLNGTFPSTTPGAVGAWTVEDYLPDLSIPSPLKVVDVPSSDHIFILSKAGEVYELDIMTKEARRVLDIKDRCFNFGEGGAVGMTVHPKFGMNVGKDELFLYYRFVPGMTGFDKGYNRMSKFTWDDQNQEFDSANEEILFQQYDAHIWHNGGAMFFDNDGFLYITLGDEGNGQVVDINLSTQRIDRGFFSGILRIDVDRDSSRSHPMQRQPMSVSNVPAGWEPTYSQGYMIPNENPWVNSNGEYLEEFFAVGLRAPYSAYYDQLNDQIWISDVGSDKFEEINLIEKGGNYQWPYMEGESPSDTYTKPNPILGVEHEPYFYYARDVGSAIVGGSIYRGSKFPSLDEKFLFGDYSSNRVMLIDHESEQDPEVLVNDIRDSGVDLPDKPGIAGLSVLKDGNVLIMVISGSDFTAPGKILQLVNKETVDDPPARLSELNAFKDMESLDAIDAFLPYEVNSPLWSDRAVKYRWVAVPNDGRFDEADEKIKFHSDKPWEFPEGTVFMKHFELPVDLQDPDKTIRLETRFFIVAEDNSAYGLTYKWNEDGSEAYLQQSRTVQSFEVTDGGIPVYDQLWEFPSRSNCMRCHNSQAGAVLGMNTHQMNKSITYPGSSIQMNQLAFFNEHDMFDVSLAEPWTYLRSVPIDDDSPDLELKIRSYLDANCAFCHRPNGVVTTSNMDLRFTNESAARFLIYQPSVSMASKNEYIVEPGHHESSEIWVRDASRDDNSMPPLASNLVDQSYVDSLAKWIDALVVDSLSDTEVRISPNPIQDYLRIDVGADFLPVYDFELYDMKGIRRLYLRFERTTEFIDLSSMEAGVYIMTLSKEGRKSTQKLMIYR